jgi:hypothetical protein
MSVGFSSVAVEATNDWFPLHTLLELEQQRRSERPPGPSPFVEMGQSGSTASLRLSKGGSHGRSGSSPPAGNNRAKALQTLDRPQLVGVVVHVERRRCLRQGHPSNLRPGKDVHVGGDNARVIERSAADVAHLRRAVLAKDGDLTVRTAKDPLDAAVVAWRFNEMRCSLEDLHGVSLDEQVDDERAACLALAVQAVTAMDEHGLVHQPIPNSPARAPALAISSHAAECYDAV